MWRQLVRLIAVLLSVGVCGGAHSASEAAWLPLLQTDDSVLKTHLLVTWYGNPNSPRMGVLGRYTGAELADGLRKQASAYEGLTTKSIIAGYELVAVVAQDLPGADGMWRRHESFEVIDSLLRQARVNGFKLVLDVQIGHSTVPAELEYLRPYLEQPDVYLALDPEFDMASDQRPGAEIGQMQASDVTYAMSFLGQLITANHLPHKVLIVHQFTFHMLPDKEKVGWSPRVDIVLDMDGFGPQWLKRDTYRMIMKQKALQFAGIKLFYEQDRDLFTPKQVMQMKPKPAVVIYQ
ncbi:MAG: hypothetical protein PVSMB1_05390 [Gemmatimonadaceae bacterium]